MSTKRKRTSAQAPVASDIFDVPDVPTGESTATNHNDVLPISASPRNGTGAGLASGARSARRGAVEGLRTPTTKRTLPMHLSKDGNPVTPSKFDTPRRNAADRSAKRKSNRRILEKAIADEGSDGESGGEDDLARKIVGTQNGDDANLDGLEDNLQDTTLQTVLHAVPSVEEGAPAPADTPMKRGRGRPKGAKNKEVTPPADLPAHEWYFWLNRSSGNTTSSNTFPTSALISHSSYHEAIQQYKNRHADNIQNLHDHHAGQFPLWEFELKMGFNLLLYGYGDKMDLLKSWADWLHRKHRREHPQAAEEQTLASKSRKKGKTRESEAPAPITIVLDAHHPALTPRSLFVVIAEATLPEEVASSIPNQPADACAFLLSNLTATSTPASPHIYLLINPIHASLLTHAPLPTLLAQLSAHPRIHLLATADDPHAPLLWPQALKDAYNWIFHDGTTFVSYDSAGTGSIAGVGVVDTVNELLGRKGARGKGREGVRWVLRSLPENARGVYRILVTEILSAADGGADADILFGAGDMELDIDFGLDEILPEDDEDAEGASRGHGRGATRGGAKGKDAKSTTGTRREDDLPAISYRTIYAKAVEEFLCSSEMAFRGLLKEFVDHQMVAIKRDMAGQEALTIEMRKDELEGVLEDLTLAE